MYEANANKVRNLYRFEFIRSKIWIRFPILQDNPPPTGRQQVSRIISTINGKPNPASAFIPPTCPLPNQSVPYKETLAVTVAALQCTHRSIDSKNIQHIPILLL